MATLWKAIYLGKTIKDYASEPILKDGKLEARCPLNSSDLSILRPINKPHQINED